MKPENENQTEQQTSSSSSSPISEEMNTSAVPSTAVKIGGSAPMQDVEGDVDEETDSSQNYLPRQTTVVGLSGLGDDEGGQGQVQVIAPEYSQENNKKNKPQSFTTASQAQIDMENQSNLKIILPIILIVILLLAAFAYYMFIGHTS